MSRCQRERCGRPAEKHVPVGDPEALLGERYVAAPYLERSTEAEA